MLWEIPWSELKIILNLGDWHREQELMREDAYHGVVRPQTVFLPWEELSAPDITPEQQGLANQQAARMRAARQKRLAARGLGRR